MPSFRVRLATVLSLATALSSAVGQPTRAAQPSAVMDATWTRTFAVPWIGRPTDPQAASALGRENRITNDPRFAALVKAAFPQHQWFWYDHHGLVSTGDMVQTFIGVPGDAILDQSRYVTLDGCVPHDCTDRGMLWIDTGVHPDALIFAGTGNVSGSPDDNSPDKSQLWIFSSTKLNWQHLPPPFLTSLRRWLETIAKPGYNGTRGYSFNFILATIVQPNGVIDYVTPETLHLRSIETGGKQ